MKPILAAVLVTGTLALAAPAAADPDGGDVMLEATLSGAAEVPSGDPDASGNFTGELDPATDQLCYDLTVADFDPATAAHIHIGDVGQNGGHVVVLETPVDGSSEACVAVDPDLAAKLIAAPQAYYVNVHNAAYPNGGLRGQLSR